MSKRACVENGLISCRERPMNAHRSSVRRASSLCASILLNNDIFPRSSVGGRVEHNVNAWSRGATLAPAARDILCSMAMLVVRSSSSRMSGSTWRTVRSSASGAVKYSPNISETAARVTPNVRTCQSRCALPADGVPGKGYRGSEKIRHLERSDGIIALR